LPPPVIRSGIGPLGVRAPTAAVRDGELTPGQRECLAALLIDVDSAARLAPVGYLIGNWQQVITAYAELAATARLGGDQHTA
jgi:hypothetical protein